MNGLGSQQSTSIFNSLNVSSFKSSAYPSLASKVDNGTHTSGLNKGRCPWHAKWNTLFSFSYISGHRFHLENRV
jgi:hypothetical protein